jgi:hypothetical protein
LGYRRAFAAMRRAIVQHGLRPPIDRVFAFHEARAAFAHLASAQHVGNVCVRVGEPVSARSGEPGGDPNRRRPRLRSSGWHECCSPHAGMRRAIIVGIVSLFACGGSDDDASTLGPVSSAGPMTAADADDDDDGGVPEPTTQDGDDAGGTGATGLPSQCGDGVLSDGEVCDGRDLAGDTCEAHGFAGGILLCAADCSAVDLRGCTAEPGVCGDGMIDAGEQCDGASFGGTTCATLGFAGGVVSCTPNCSLDASDCTDAACADMLEDCSVAPCCPGLFCVQADGEFCGLPP